MKKALLALLLVLPLAGCAHQGGGYTGGGAGYFYDECLYPDGCYDGIYQPGYFYYPYGTQIPRAVERARVTGVPRTTSTRVVSRQTLTRPTAAGSTSARSAPRALSPRCAPAPAPHTGGHRS